MAIPEPGLLHRQPAVHRTIVVVDVEAFGDRKRTNANQTAVREGLYRALEQAFDRAGIPWGECDHEDRGDGVFILAPADHHKTHFVDALPDALVVALAEHNATHPPEERIRLRMALHAGEVAYDEHGVTAASVNLAFRLADARPLKDALDQSTGMLVLIVSEWFYQEVVRNSRATDRNTFRPFEVKVKETATTGWISRPDDPYPPTVARTTGRPRTASFWFAVATVLVVVAAVVSASSRSALAERFCGRPHVVSGAILDKYKELGGPNSNLRCPAGDQTSTPDGHGRRMRFDNAEDGGDEQWIYWSPETGAHPVWGRIGDKWAALGPERLGFPTGDEESLRAPRTGKSQRFEHATIYWQPSRTNMAYALLDDKIGEKWRKLDRLVGLPVTDEVPTADGNGARQDFEDGGIYWHDPSNQAYMVPGSAGGFHEKWRNLGYESGRLGAPKADEVPTADREGRKQEFERGTTYWHLSRSKGAHTVWPGEIDTKWAQNGREGGPYGYPIRDEFPDGTGCRQSFEWGDITSPRSCTDLALAGSG